MTKTYLRNHFIKENYFEVVHQEERVLKTVKKRKVARGPTVNTDFQCKEMEFNCNSIFSELRISEG